MPEHDRGNGLRKIAPAAIFLLSLGFPAVAQDAEALRERHAAVRDQLSSNSFGRPLHVESTEASGEHAGTVYAVIDQPFDTVQPALRGAQRWCRILILPVNVKGCEAPRAGAADALALYIARKPQDSMDEAYRVDFRYDVAAATRDYLHVALGSAQGPFGTTDYRIKLEAAPIDGRRTFIHMSYSYVLGFGARIAMSAYLATSGRDKVGFSVVDRAPDGRPVYIDGARGAIERNTMRYYLAVEAYLDSLTAPAGQRLETRLRDWYAGIERYPRQLREQVKREEYLRMKLTEAQPLEAGSAAGATR
jgi:hypothetical protein